TGSTGQRAVRVRQHRRPGEPGIGAGFAVSNGNGAAGAVCVERTYFQVPTIRSCARAHRGGLGRRGVTLLFWENSRRGPRGVVSYDFRGSRVSTVVLGLSSTGIRSGPRGDSLARPDGSFGTCPAERRNCCRGRNRVTRDPLSRECARTETP